MTIRSNTHANLWNLRKKCCITVSGKARSPEIVQNAHRPLKLSPSRVRVYSDFAAALFVLCRNLVMSEGFNRLLVLFALLQFGGMVKFGEPMALR